MFIAADFTKYDEYAVMQIPRNIELLRYRRYGTDLLLLELVNSGTGARAAKLNQPVLIKELQDLWAQLNSFLLSLGSDVTVRELEHYVAFRRLKNFACVRVLQGNLQIWLKLDPASVELQQGFTRDVSDIGHQGTGNLEVRIQTVAGLVKAKPLLSWSYLEN